MRPGWTRKGTDDYQGPTVPGLETTGINAHRETQTRTQNAALPLCSFFNTVLPAICSVLPKAPSLAGLQISIKGYKIHPIL